MFFLSKRIFVQINVLLKKIGSKRIVLKKIWVNKILNPKKSLDPKYFGETFWVKKKNRGPDNVGSKTILDPKSIDTTNFGSNKFWD